MNRIEHRLQSIVDAQIGRGSVYNVVAAVQSFDRTIDFCGAAGTADPLSGAQMTPDTPYFIASTTKMYTVAIILHLHEQKRVDLDAPICAYLSDPMIRGIHVYKGTDYSEQIKVCHLVSQTSGLADYEADKPRGGKSVLADLKAGHDRAISTAEAIEITRRLSPGLPLVQAERLIIQIRIIVCSARLSNLLQARQWLRTLRSWSSHRLVLNRPTYSTGLHLAPSRFRRPAI